MRVRHAMLALFGSLLAAIAVHAQVQSRVQDGSFGRELHAIAHSSTDSKEALPKLEAIAARPELTADQKTQVNGIRVHMLLSLKRVADARVLAESLVAERPDLPERYLILANAAFAGEDFPATAKAIMAATLHQPDLVNQLPTYEIMMVAHQLDSAGKDELAAAFGQRLFDAGWDKGRVGLRSAMALDVIRALIDEGRVADTNRYLPLIWSPTAYSSLLTEARYLPVRDAATAWAGPHLEKQWPIYLEGTKRAWLADRSPDTAADYAAALSLAGHNRTLVQEFLPQLSRNLDRDEDDLWIFLYPPVTDALASLGRWDDAFALLDSGNQVWPAGWGANSINISANRARLRLLKGDFGTAVGLFDQVLKEAEPVALEVTPPTLALLQSYRICALHQTGAGNARAMAEKLAEQWTAREPVTVAWMEICLGQRDAALKSLLAGLDLDEGRAKVLSFAQPRSDTSVDSDFAREMAEALDSLGHDPVLLKAIKTYGHRRSWRIRDSAPAEQTAYSR